MTKKLTIIVDQIVADLAVPKGNLLTNDPGLEMMVKNLSIQTKLTRNALVCRLVYCMNKKNLHV
jgi:hypothetical protein